ncbi:MAG: hydrogenase iron-sulfur subunit [Armatimonadota bacterium]|nr:hydrogenase iron-sulfur subunit [Armatimonadota bacterium]MDR7536457.1 hydrogenase iron-sulfur subunit [Armatimonadota bacterium]
MTAQASTAHGAWAPRIVGFVCDWAVATTDLADAAGRLLAHPSVVLIRIPCSGFIRPGWLEDALKAGADGVFVVGCPYGDCLNREGNYLMRERVDQLQRRLQRRRVPPERLQMLAHGLHDREAFLADIAAMVERLRALGPAASGTGPARRPAAAAQPAEEGGA